MTFYTLKKYLKFEQKNLILHIIKNKIISSGGGYEMTAHTSHPNIIKRLKRAEGHLRSIIVMLEDERDCLEIAQQLQAVESAITNAKKILVHDHIDHCLEHALDQHEDASKNLASFKAITKYL